MVIVFIVVVLLYFEVDIFGELILVVMVVINVILFVLLMLCVSVLYWYSLYFILSIKKKKSFEKFLGKLSLLEYVFFVI